MENIHARREYLSAKLYRGYNSETPSPRVGHGHSTLPVSKALSQSSAGSVNPFLLVFVSPKPDLLRGQRLEGEKI
jgi:hypothetical protein